MSRIRKSIDVYFVIFGVLGPGGRTSSKNPARGYSNEAAQVRNMNVLVVVSLKTGSICKMRSHSFDKLPPLLCLQIHLEKASPITGLYEVRNIL